MHFTVSAGLPDDPPPPMLDITVTDPARIESVYDALAALENFPDGTISCPLDIGVTYYLHFTKSDGTIVAEADVNPTGCEGVDLKGSLHGTRWTIDADDTFYPTLANALSIDEAQIYPYPDFPSF
jgi:hypothetical protein